MGAEGMTAGVGWWACDTAARAVAGGWEESQAVVDVGGARSL